MSHAELIALNDLVLITWEDEDHVLNFARAIEAHHGITPPESKG